VTTGAKAKETVEGRKKGQNGAAHTRNNPIRIVVRVEPKEQLNKMRGQEKKRTVERNNLPKQNKTKH
jgi:hypothetical protein